MASETPAPEPGGACAEGLDISAEGGLVLLRVTACRLTPDAAEAIADQLRAAAEEARRGAGPSADERRKPPFPPSELVSPHGAA